MKLWHIDTFAFTAGLLSLLLMGLFVNWYAAAALFLGIWGNNASNMAHRLRRERMEREIRSEINAAARRFMDDTFRARSAAPGGVGNPNTNTEAEVAGKERP